MTNKTKNILLISAAVILAVLVVMGILTKKPAPNCGNPEFAEYISAYTEGTISKGSSIKVVLNSSIADSINKDMIEVDKLFTLYPSTKGTTKFLDERTIEFTPDKPLSSDTKYIVKFRLYKICSPKHSLKRFVFPVSVIAQDMKLNIDEQVTTDRSTLKYQRVTGSIKTADFESIEAVKSAVSASIGRKVLPIKWKETGLGDIFNFTIDSIVRLEEPQTLAIRCDGAPIGSKNSHEKKLTIPAINDFDVSSVKVINSPTQHIRIQFTDPIKETQNLDGLVTVGDDDAVAGETDYKIETSDNCINLYPPNKKSGKAHIFLAAGIQNVLGTKLSEDMSFELSYEMQKPEIRSVKTGLILPDGENGLVYPFEAINLTAVDVTIVKVLENNILSYIRDYSDYYNANNLQQTGVPVFRKTIQINTRESEDVTEWKRYYLELSKLIKSEPGAIYNIRIAFRKSHAIFDCDSCNGGDDISMEKDFDISDFDNWSGYYESLDNYYYESAGYNWRNSENPCYKMYYQSDRFINQNILASNLGIIAKKGDDESLSIFVTDLKSASPVQGATVELYGYQQQMITSANTNQDGLAYLGAQPKGYFVVVKRGNESNYLKLQDGNSLSMSKFDISGAKVQNGLKGFIYGERGIWRPGDSIHLSFVLNEDLKKPLPEGFPITMEVRNPLSQQIFKETVNKKSNNFYVFNLKTDSEAVTGNYEATITCGNAQFRKMLRIENVLPNRLKISTGFNKDILTADGNAMNISSQWLHGATARNLKVDVEMMLSEKRLSFPQWKEYSFGNDKETSYLPSSWQSVYNGYLNEAGKATFRPTFDANPNQYPALMNVRYSIKVFEKGGRFSKDETSIDVMPHKYHIGIRMPENDDRFMYVNEQQDVDIVVTDSKGNLINDKRQLKVKLYQLQWQWWYDSDNYVSEYNSTLIDEQTMSINGKGQYSFSVNYPNWGRFMLDVTDTKTGISSSKIFYMDWPNSFGRSPILSQGSTIIELSANKTDYKVGEMAKITIPSSKGGKALISIENGTKVISSQWISTKEGKTEFMFNIEPDMEPGVYVFVTLLQPHEQTINDIPIRMYGVLPLNVENPDTRLEPEISMPDVLQAEQDVHITVSEKNGKNMTYTIALVDDGLLDLNHFKTPDPWKQFYSREALGVKTIDMYDNVIGAFGGRIERMFSIGGDGESGPASAAKANNFESVVAFLGPFTINGGSKKHTIKMPKYIGSVRTMVVAGNGKAYGKAEKTCTVTKPLMVFATTPRIIGTEEKFKLPITVFTGDENIKNVTVKIKASDGLSINGESSKTITFNGKGEQNPSFEIASGNKNGVGSIEVTATSGNHVSNIDLKLEIRQPNTRQQQVISKAVKAGETVSIPIKPIGRKGTNTATISVNAILPINYDGHIANLMSHPYENLENTVCKAFPMIYAPSLTDIKGQAKEMGENLIRESIKKIYDYQTSFGGLSYWRGESYTNVWLTSFAGHFMLEAKKAGYSVKPEFLDKWKKFQRLKAESWTPDNRFSYEEQAYRLYTLALAGDAQNGQMNRLKEQPNLTNEARIYLAAAYTLSGKKEIGERLMGNLAETFNSNSPAKLITLCDLNNQEKAYMVAKTLSDELSAEYYWMYSEHECMSLVALGKYFDKYKPASDIKCEYTMASQGTEKIDTDRIFASKSLKLDGEDKPTLTFTNNSKGTLYVEITNKGIPEPGCEKAENSVITAELKFYQVGKEISPKSLKQGEDFTAVIKVKNLGDEYLSNVAITEMFPSGWEIMTGWQGDDDDYDDDYYYYSRRGSIKYTDTRDDRKYTYFTLPAGGEMEFRTQLTATYAGTYYLPGLICEDLENPRIFAKTKGMMVTVEDDE